MEKFVRSYKINLNMEIHGESGLETLLLLYLLFGTKYTCPIFQVNFNYDLVDIRTSPLAPPTTRTSYQELALNSRESKGAEVFPRIAGYFRFSLAYLARFVWAASFQE